MGLAPCRTHGGCTVELQTVFGTAVKVTLSGDVLKVTVVVSVPVVVNVIRQLTHGVFFERFDMPAWVASVVKVKVKEQS